MLLGDDDDDDKVIMIVAAKDNGGDDVEDESMTFFRAGETWTRNRRTAGRFPPVGSGNLIPRPLPGDG